MVSVAPCADYSAEQCKAALENAINSVDGLSWVRPGMKIAVKANLVSMLRPAAAATTHPALIAALVEMLAERGARAVVGDSPGGLFTAVYVDRVYSAAGMRALVSDFCALNSDYSCREANFPGAVKAKRFEYTGWLDTCDGIIDFCKLKTHGMMGMSAAVKNMFGAIPGTRKPEMHYLFPDAADFADMLVDLNEYFKPKLAIVDAVVGMDGNGPTMGKPHPLGLVLTGQSVFEVDKICARIIGADESAVPTLAAAARRGLCPDAPDVIGDIARFTVSDFTPATPRDMEFLPGTPLGPLLNAFLCAKPSAMREKCVGCGKCAEVCPAHAIIMRDKRPEISRKTCIRCFCCQEFCPVGAMISKRPLIARILSK